MKIMNWINTKKGQGLAKVNYLFAGLIVIVFATALAPTMFERIQNLSGVAGVPSWVSTILPIVVGAGLVFLIWRSIMQKE